MRRREALAAIARGAEDALLVCNIGHPSQELYELGDRPNQFYMLGSMGLASPIGMGLALMSERPAVVIDGDGALLMNLGALSSIGRHQPRRLLVVAVHNGVNGSTGEQPTAAGLSTDLRAVGQACGIEDSTEIDAREVDRAEELESTVRSFVAAPHGPSLLVARVQTGSGPLDPIPLSPTLLRDRLRVLAAGAQPGSPSLPPPPASAPAGPAGLATRLRQAGVDVVCSVPDRSLAGFLRTLDAVPGLIHLPVTREEEGVGICAGAALTGATPMLVLQNSGIGNSVNALASLTSYYRLPLLLLIAHRGMPGETIGAQTPMGAATAAILDAIGIPHFAFDEPGQLERVPALVNLARIREGVVAALVAPGAMAGI